MEAGGAIPRGCRGVGTLRGGLVPAKVGGAGTAAPSHAGTEPRAGDGPGSVLCHARASGFATRTPLSCQTPPGGARQRCGRGQPYGCSYGDFMILNLHNCWLLPGSMLPDGGTGG